MTIQNTNVGYAFPLEKLGSDLARNDFNYQSILRGLIEWDRTNDDIVNYKKYLCDINSNNNCFIHL